MKNKYKISLLLLFVYLNFFSNLKANDFNFQTSEIKITDNGNIVDASNGEATSVDGNIQIIAEKFNYNKYKSVLNASSNATATLMPQNIRIKANNIQYDENTFTFNAKGKAIVKDLKKNIEIKADNIEYNRMKSVFNAKGDVVLRDLTTNVLIKSQNIFFDAKNKIISSNTKTTIEDNVGNIFLTESFSFNQINNLIKINNSKLIDFEKNTYFLSKGFIDLSLNQLAGKDISINFNNKSFNKDNEPRLKGNSILHDENKTIINKGVFTTCKKNDDCPPWQMSAKKVTHDKDKKTINYDQAWLKLYDKPIVYFPKFFHPDPTVKRQSGFLMPSLSDSTSLGSSLNVPYFKVISDNKDLTLRPRLYSNKILLQSEYRQANKDSNHTLDFSYMSDKNPTKNHFFSKSNANVNFQNFDESEIRFQIQQVSNDTYLKTYKLESPIINDYTTLNSSLEFETYREDLSFNTSFHVFETLGVRNNDRYEFIYPNYSLTKKFEENFGFNGSLSLTSSGFIKNYNTNVFEKVNINDFIFNTNPKTTDIGLRSDFNFLVKNVNAQSSMSEKYSNDDSYRLASLMQYNLSYPLLKETEKYVNRFKPLMTVKFSPN
ncbi:LPS-assembly protein LptD, partial [Pelagibacterales bacterium SAG-MED20]|nr:LPS-assembly protein LptD [Pelagibacterales bacterium SAG-MED20]